MSKRLSLNSKINTQCPLYFHKYWGLYYSDNFKNSENFSCRYSLHTLLTVAPHLETLEELFFFASGIGGK